MNEIIPVGKCGVLTDCEGAGVWMNGYTAQVVQQFEKRPMQVTETGKNVEVECYVAHVLVDPPGVVWGFLKHQLVHIDDPGDVYTGERKEDRKQIFEYLQERAPQLGKTIKGQPACVVVRADPQSGGFIADFCDNDKCELKLRMVNLFLSMNNKTK